MISLYFCLVLVTCSFPLKVTNEDKTKSDELRNIRIRLEQSRSTFSANTSRGRILDGLMEQKRKGTLPGIFGRLGDLGAIDEKYDGSVSTACGPLDNIVVDTVDTAQKCIAYLKNGNLGRASFIALEKMVRSDLVSILGSFRQFNFVVHCSCSNTWSMSPSNRLTPLRTYHDFTTWFASKTSESNLPFIAVCETRWWQKIWNRPLASAMVLVLDTALSRWKVGPYLGDVVLRL